MPAPRILLAIPTHTDRHLALCLAALAAQTRRPDAVCVSCDGEHEGVRRVCAAAAERGLRPLLLASREHTGEPRLNQVRNNALRALAERADPRPEDLVVVIDGDIALAPDALGRHARLAEGGAGVILPNRINLDEAATAALRDEDVRAGRLMEAVGGVEGVEGVGGVGVGESVARERRRLAERQKRIERQAAWHRVRSLLPPRVPFPLKAHKPKLLGGHHAVRWGLLEAVNGYDERFVGYGYDDDDLARRLYALRPAPRVAAATDAILALHLWHPTRAPARPTQAPGYAVFTAAWTPRAVSGLAGPAPQPRVRIEVF